MKKEKIKIFIIVILIVLLVIFSILLINRKQEKTQIAIDDTKLTEDEIYQEVLTEVLYGEEKYITHDENGNRVNISNKMKEAVTVNGEGDLEVQKIDIYSKDNKTIIEGSIKNNGNAALGDEILTLSLKDDTGIEILGVGIYVDKMQSGESSTFQTYATMDLANAYSYSVSK